MRRPLRSIILIDTRDCDDMMRLSDVVNGAGPGPEPGFRELKAADYFNRGKPK